VEFVRKVANSNILADIIDIPESLRDRKVEILVLPYGNVNTEEANDQPKRARGLLEKYKNKELIETEKDVWTRALVEKYENS
jgi:hypothetical protein